MVFCVAHRGASGLECENSRRSVARALELGSDWIEVDVQAVQGELFVFHDFSTERLTGVKGKLAEMTLEQVDALRLSNGETIPTLWEIVRLVGTRSKLCVELKGPGIEQLTVKVLQDAISQGVVAYESLMVISFDHVQLREVRRLDEMLPTGALLMGLPAALAQFGEDAAVQSINLQRDFISRELIDDAHRRGIVVQAWTVDDLAQLERLAFLGVDGIVTNYPDRALEWLRANGRHRSC